MNDRNLLDADAHLVLAKLRLKPLTLLSLVQRVQCADSGRLFSRYHSGINELSTTVCVSDQPPSLILVEQYAKFGLPEPSISIARNLRVDPVA